MRKRTTTYQLKQVISNNLLKVTKVEIYSKDSRDTKKIDADIFKESLEFACESIFADCIGWHFEKNHESDGYIAETGRMNPDSEIIITVYLSVCNYACREEVGKVLSVVEEE